MQHLNDINDNLLHLRDSNRHLKRSVSDKDKELEKLKNQNFQYEKRIRELESLVDKCTTDTLSDFSDVIIQNKGVKKVEVIEKSDYCDQKFEQYLSEISIKAIRLDFRSYSEIANYLKQEIRVKTGIECFVSVGLHQNYSFQTWSYKHRKYIALKIGSLLFVVNQIHTKFTDVLNHASQESLAEIIEKSDQIDAHFEKLIIELAQSMIKRGIKSSSEVAQCMKEEMIEQYGKLYGTNWLVAVGYGPFYDVCYSVRISKRKYLDFSIDDLRFTVFQTL